MSIDPSPTPKTDIFALSNSASVEKTIQGPPPGSALMKNLAQYPAPPVAFGDFVILRELGRGAFAAVYLARQISLERDVALKVSERPGHSEGLALAGLEHDHIVRVYSEFADAESGKHCLCLQYVPGPTLAKVIAHLHQKGNRSSGKILLDTLDELATEAIGFDPVALRFREELAQSNFAEAVCRLGARLAEALAFAHARGVLHCDIKPANILLNRYGKPHLADFNVAVDTSGNSGSGVGGTFVYMAPEHLAAFMRKSSDESGAVDAKSDLYSLGIVLVEFLTGDVPLPPLAERKIRDFLPELLTFRRQPLEAMIADSERIPPVVRRVLRRCLHPDPRQRYPDAQALAQALLRR